MNKEEKIAFAKQLMEGISDKFLQEGNQYIINPGYEYLRDVMTLYAKQTNLLESTLILIEHNHAEEAYVLFRSLLNNHMLIIFLINDTDERKRYKEYSFQPYKTQLQFLYNIKFAANKGWMSKPNELNKKIKEWEKIMKENNCRYNEQWKTYDTSTLGIAKMAKKDAALFGIYMEFYREGSAYEHSDPTSLELYRGPVLDDVPNTVAFTMDLSRTSEELEEKVLNWSLKIYGLTFVKLMKHISDKHPDLIEEERKPELLGLMMAAEISAKL